MNMRLTVLRHLSGRKYYVNVAHIGYFVQREHDNEDAGSYVYIDGQKLDVQESVTQIVINLAALVDLSESEDAKLVDDE